MRGAKGIYKHGPTLWKWEIMYQGQRKYGYAHTEAEAIKDRAEALRQFMLGKYNEQDTTTLGGMVHQLLETEWSEENCKSHDWFVRNTRLIMRYFGPTRPLVEITSKAITDYVIYLKKESNSSNGTINRKLAALSKILRIANEQGYINQCPVIRRQREPQGRVRFLSKEEEEQMYTFFEHRHMTVPLLSVTVLIETGMRCGELQALTKDEIMWAMGKHGAVLLKDTKNGSSRTVPLTKKAHDALKSLLGLSNDEYLVPRGDWLRGPWNSMKRALGLNDDKEFVPHALRHTCASRLVQRGVPLFTVSQWLGHKSMQTTKRYAHLRPEDLASAMECLEEDE